MPEIVGEAVTPEKAKELRAWLKKPEGRFLRTVIAAKLRLGQEKALEQSMKATPANSYSLSADETLRFAMRYASALAVLDEVESENSPLETLRFKP